MILRNPREGWDGIPAENIFEAVEPRTGEVRGRCTVYEERRPLMFPERPYQIRLFIEADAEEMDMLLGAAIARARMLCTEQSEPSRIYADCAADDSEMLESLKQYGFRDNDGLLRLRLRLPGNFEYKQPAGCVIVNDALEDAQEQRYFLERYNDLYCDNKDNKWLSSLRTKKSFRRILTVAPTGMAGEVLVWMEGDVGVIEFFDTARRWRGMGVATCMVALACNYLAEQGARYIMTDVRAKMHCARHVLEKSGFEQDALLCRYPGIDI